MKPKKLSGLTAENYEYPLADVSHLSADEQKALLRRGLRMPKDLHSDEEFEQWVTIFAGWNTYCYPNGYQPTKEERERDKLQTACYERGLWYHKKQFNEWKKTHLQPLIDELVEKAEHDPQYDWQYLYSLEYSKLRCMRAYFSHSLIADETGDFGFNRWIDICISLLEHLKEDGNNISEEQVAQMNTRNVKDIVPEVSIALFKDAVDEDNEDAIPGKLYRGREIYVRKMERLYYKIRLFKLREWWE